MLACERVFKQAVWLWGQIFPRVTGNGEGSGTEDPWKPRESRDNGTINRSGAASRPAEDDDEDSANLP
jgi:hypothetical protein